MEKGCFMALKYTIAFHQGAAYQSLQLAHTDLKPRLSSGYSPTNGYVYDGWAYMMRTPDSKIALLYFENECQSNIVVNGLNANATYRAQWYNTCTGEWIPMNASGTLTASSGGSITLPDYPVVTRPAGTADWAAKLTDTSMPVHIAGAPNNQPQSGAVCRLVVAGSSITIVASSQDVISVDLLTLNGRVVRHLHNGLLAGGSRTMHLDGPDMAPGAYLFEVRQSTRVVASRVVVTYR
jgi:hypothetical protein